MNKREHVIKDLNQLRGFLLLQADKRPDNAYAPKLAIWADAAKEAAEMLTRNAKPEKDEVISHLQIMHTWASYAAERGLLLNDREIAKIADWSLEAAEYLK